MAKSIGEKLGPRLHNGSMLFSNRKIAKISDMEKLEKEDIEWLRTYTIFLKASGYTPHAMSEFLGVSKSIIKKLLDDKKTMERVRQVQADLVSGGLSLLQHAQVRLVMGLLDIAEREPDAAVRLRAIESGLDRAGNVKVNKSESRVTRNDETGKSLFEQMFEEMAGAPLEDQQRAVELFGELEIIAAKSKAKEGKDK